MIRLWTLAAYSRSRCSRTSNDRERERCHTGTFPGVTWPEGRHNAVIYNRVSTQDQLERTDLNSLISHEERCLHYIHAQGWHHLRTYEDPALSASSLNRPQLQRLLLELDRLAPLPQRVMQLAELVVDLGEVALIPGTGGVFQIHCDGELIWDRKHDGGFPDAKTLKQRVRDRLDPARDLGHIDRA